MNKHESYGQQLARILNEHRNREHADVKQFAISGDPHTSTPNIYTVILGSHVKLHFSYKTLVGVHIFDERSESSYMQPNIWGNTTGKHMRIMGLEPGIAQIRSEEELWEIVRGALWADVVHTPLNNAGV